MTNLFEDSRYRIWIATQGGGCCYYDTRTRQFKRFNTSTGFPSNVVMRIIEDQQANLWFTTNQGLVCMKSENEELRLFTTTNGLLSDQFNYQSGIVDTDGTIYLGSIDGLISFKPQNIRRGPVAPKLIISDFYIFNDRVGIQSSEQEAETMDGAKYEERVVGPLKCIESERKEFYMDYIEYCPKEIYDNPAKAEDIW